MPGCQTPLERETVRNARTSLAAYANMEELIRIGAYRAGADAEVDRAIALNPSLEGFLAQDKDDFTSLPDAFDRLDGILEREGR
jgi:flagellum-specific ATP synthase